MAGKIHVLAISFPAQGHINPMVHFAKRLASKGLRITLVIPTSYRDCKAAAQVHETSTFKIEFINDGSEKGKAESIDAYFRRMEVEHSKNLSNLMEKLIESNQCPNALIYDSLMPWSLEVAHQHGLPGAAFFAIYCGFNSVYYHKYKGLLKINIEEQSVEPVPALPQLEIKDLPCYPYIGRFNHGIDTFYANQFRNVEKADWILINTFDTLESEILNWMAKKFPTKTIGPTYLKHDKLNGVDDRQLHESYSCIKWLDRREMSTVVYVSFGTIVELEEEQMKEMAKALMSSSCYFLWIVRSDEQSKLPANFKSEISEKGLILEWCPQSEVLAHQAVACFITHCGWNSILESLSSGVPMIAVPYMIDQPTNSKFIEEVWEAGVRAKDNSEGIFTGEEIETCITEVTQKERGKKLKQNALRWKDEIQKATAPGGSSYRNIEDFVSQLLKI